MRTSRLDLFKTTAIALVLAQLACSEAKFQTGTSTPAAYTSADQAPVPVPVETPKPEIITVDETAACPENSIIQNSFPPDVAACYESGRVWNFGSNSCVQMRAAEFECKWENVKSELAKIGLKSGDVDAASLSDVNRLVGCGQSTDKMRIVVQWVTLPKVDAKCSEIKPSNVVTGCFTNYGTKTPPAPPVDQAERDKRNYECMDTL